MHRHLTQQIMPSILIITISIITAIGLIYNIIEASSVVSDNCPVGVKYLGETNVIRQLTPYDCGTACVQMILNKHGVKAEYENIKNIAGTDKNGTSIFGIKKTLINYGFKAYASVLSHDDLTRIDKPFIAYINKSHFVIVDSVTKEGCLIVLDPSAGKLLYNKSYFQKQWTGYAITYH